MVVVRDLQGQGTPEQVWEGLVESLSPLDLGRPRGRVVVVVPHPDDEVLGVGGLLRQLAQSGTPVIILAVTDGEASHPGRADELRVRRALERADALSVLGSAAIVLQLGHPDGDIDEALLRRQISDHVRADDVLLAPWEHDGHPDHDRCGRAALGQVRSSWAYLVWAWHWATPADLPTERLVRVDLSSADHKAKVEAVQRYVSQLEGDEPILPPHVLRRLTRRSEVLMPS